MSGEDCGARAWKEMHSRTLFTEDCDIGMARIPDGSIDLILTDPPYLQETYQQAYGTLARHAARILKPSGFLVTYSAHFYLPWVMGLLSQSLEWYCLMVQENRAPRARIWNRNLTAAYKPILIFQKAPLKKQEWFGVDILPRSYMEKRYHKWQQSLKEALYLAELYGHPGDTVLDPFAGSGTSLLAAELLGMPWMGFEIDPKVAETARGRLSQTTLADLPPKTLMRPARAVDGRKTKGTTLKGWA